MNPERAKQIVRGIKNLVKNGSPFNVNEIRIILALECAIARLSFSQELAEHLIFKGGFVLLKSYDSFRFTRDADALAVIITKEKLKRLVYAALSVDLDDGLWFGDIQMRELTGQGEYGAYRFDFAFQLGKPDLGKLRKLSRVHLDVSFNDKLPSKPLDQVMPSVLEREEQIVWKIYPVEYIIAEKIQTLIERGSANSRAKDIFDLNFLLPRCKNREALLLAIKNTFENRGTALPSSFAACVRQFDERILNAAWPGIKILDEKVKFDIAWNTLINILEALDEGR